MLNKKFLEHWKPNLSVFIDFPVYNNISERILIPGVVEAEDFTNQEGLSVSETTDINGGYKIGYTDAGDFAEYSVLITEPGQYDVNFRVASAYDSGSVRLDLINGSNIQYLTQISLPVTGGWETWETVSADLSLPSGSYNLKMSIVQAGFDINWIGFDFTGNSMQIPETDQFDFILSPNPATDYINLETNLNIFNVEIYDILGKKVHVSKNKKIIDVMNLDSGIYFLNIKSGLNFSSKSFIKK